MKTVMLILSIILMILGVLVALVSPVAGVALIALGIVGVIVFRKKKGRPSAAVTEPPAPVVTKSIKEDFFVVGMDYYKKAIEGILTEEPLFDYSKKRLDRGRI